MPAAPAAPREALDLSPETRRLLGLFEDRLRVANARTNLVGVASLADFWGRHVLDSAQLATFAPAAEHWVDIGSGAGFPGMVLAILCKAKGRGRVDLVESRTRRCAFLREAAIGLDLPAKVWNARAETLAFAADVVTARACAPLPRLLAYAEGFLKLGAAGLFLKGEAWRGEVEAARKTWRFDLTTFASLSDPRGRVLLLEGARRGR